jgi:alkylation response protein AidB-like acyl-CoA dehydrogenase
MAIDLSLEPHQLELQRAARGLFSARCPRSTVRELEGTVPGYQPDLWEEMAELGWLGLPYPSAYGGGEGSFIDLYVIYEEMGRALVPSPHLDTVALAGDLIMRVGTEEQKQKFLPDIAAGRCVISVATIEPSGVFDPSGIAMSATGKSGSLVLSGQKLLVAFTESADHYLVTARTGAAGRAGITVALVDAAAPGISVERLPNIAAIPLYGVAFDGVSVPEDAVVGEASRGWAAFAESATRAAVLQTSSIIGAARVVLEMTNQYAKDRQQFGSPIGSYQAVQYMVSDVLIDMHRLDMLGIQAAYRIAAEAAFEMEAAMAIAFGKRQAAHFHRQAHEVHAGIGFMQEYDLQLYSRRSKYWENNLGDAAHYYEQVAQALEM